MSFETALNVIQIFISIILILVILLQAKGSAFGSALGGSSGHLYRTRRGVEKTLFQTTIVLTSVFLLISAVNVVATR